MKPNYRNKKKVSPVKSVKNMKALFVGVGLDSQDGHVRVTKGSNFRLLGGSEQTHEVMQETAVKLNEELKKRGKQLEEVGPSEFFDIVHKVRPN